MPAIFHENICGVTAVMVRNSMKSTSVNPEASQLEVFRLDFTQILQLGKMLEDIYLLQGNYCTFV